MFAAARASVAWAYTCLMAALSLSADSRAARPSALRWTTLFKRVCASRRIWHLSANQRSHAARNWALFGRDPASQAKRRAHIRGRICGVLFPLAAHACSRNSTMSHRRKTIYRHHALAVSRCTLAAICCTRLPWQRTTFSLEGEHSPPDLDLRRKSCAPHSTTQ